jgi:hypothetical protein
MDLASWDRLLESSGVMRVPLTDVPPGAAGRAVEDAREARRLLQELAVQRADRPDPRSRRLVGLSALIAVVLALGAFGTAYWPIGFVLLTGCFGALLHRYRRDRSRESEEAKAAELRQRRELHARIRALAGRTFVALVGKDTLVINTPHLTFLEARIHDVDRAWGRMLDRDRALARLRKEMVESNRSLGREEIDAEVVAIDEERARIEVSEPAFKDLRDELEARLHKAGENVEYLAEVGRRQALSRQLGGVLDRGAQESLAELAASLEIDIAAVELDLRRLDVSLSDADASLRALLEVEALTRQK